MKHAYFFTAFFAAALFAGCVQDDLGNDPVHDDPISDRTIIRAGISQPETRTQFGEQIGKEMPLHWSAGDQIKLYSPAKTQVVDGQQQIVEGTGIGDGSAYGWHLHLQHGEGTANGTFVLDDTRPDGTQQPPIAGALPGNGWNGPSGPINYNLAAYGLNGGIQFSTNHYGLKFNYPALQTYRAGSIGPNTLPMGGLWTGDADGNFSDIEFFPAGAVLCIQLYSPEEGTTVSSIEVSSNAEGISTTMPNASLKNYLAGEMGYCLYYKSSQSSDDNLINVTAYEDAKALLTSGSINGFRSLMGAPSGVYNTITLACNDATISNDAAAPTKFYIVVAPLTQTEGFSVKVNAKFADGVPADISKTKRTETAFPAGSILPMAPFAIEKPQEKPTAVPDAVYYANGNWAGFAPFPSALPEPLVRKANPIIAWPPIEGIGQYIYTVNGGEEIALQSNEILCDESIPDGAKVVVYASNSAGRADTGKEVTVSKQYTLTLSQKKDVEGVAGQQVPIRWSGNDTDGYTLTIGADNGLPTTKYNEIVYCSLQNGQTNDAVAYYFPVYKRAKDENGQIYLVESTLQSGGYFRQSDGKDYYSQFSYAHIPVVEGLDSNIGIVWKFNPIWNDSSTNAMGYSTASVNPMTKVNWILQEGSGSRATNYINMRMYYDYGAPTPFAENDGWGVEINMSKSFLTNLAKSPDNYVKFNYVYGDKSIPVKIVHDPDFSAE